MHPSTILAALFAAVSWGSVIDLHISVDEHEDSDVSTQQGCYWSGTSPFCAGACDSGYSDCATSSCGDGACCWTGYKKYCCRGGCSGVIPGLDASPTEPHGLTHTRPDIEAQSGRYDDICGKGQELCCPKGASENKDCTCVDKHKSIGARKKRIPLLRSQRVMDDPDKKPDNDICEPGEEICCPLGSNDNDQCTCLPPDHDML